MADGEPFIISELEGDFRSVELADAALPEKGVKEESKLRLVKSWYPGQKRASVQVMGTEDGDTPITGWLKDTWLGAAGAALEIKNSLKAIHRGQRLCSMQWGRTIDQVGFIRELRFFHDRDADIRYEIVFDVVESGEAEAVASRPFEQATETTLINEIIRTEREIDIAQEIAFRVFSTVTAILVVSNG